MKNSMKLKIGVTLFILFISIVIIYAAYRADTEEIVCAADVMACPDGSFVKRVPPDCDFEECPDVECKADVKTCPDGEVVVRIPPECEFRACTGFAKCVGKVSILYTDATCPACKGQKEMFGETFKYLNYIECSETPDLCADAGIIWTPTWDFFEREPGDVRYESWLTLGGISYLTGCNQTWKE